MPNRGQVCSARAEDLAIPQNLLPNSPDIAPDKKEPVMTWVQHHQPTAFAIKGQNGTFARQGLMDKATNELVLEA